MATEKEKLLKVKEIKTSIKDVINSNGGNVSDVFSEYPLAIENLLTGGGGSDSPKGQYRIRYLDIDGTILKEEYLNEGDSLTPPDNPNYDSDYLVFDSWNYDIENTVVDRNLDIGAIYNTIDNCTYMFCRFITNTGLNPTLNISGSVTINWGDGTVDTNLTHTYASDGEYIIKISGSFSFSTGSSIRLLGSSDLNKSLQKAYLGNVTSIGTYAFSSCYSLQSIVIPNSVTSIGERVFNDCYSLQSIVIPNSVISIGTYAFNDCYSLQSIVIPNSVTSISSSIFYNCYSLQSIVIPNGVTSIGGSAFNNCYSLQSIVIPNGVTSIGGSAFSVCYSLQSIVIPNGVTSIGTYAFNNCYSLQSIVIPNSVTSIGERAFNNCYSLTNYFILCETVPTLSNTNAFNNINKSCIMWVNDSIIEDLKVATNWSTYASYMKKLSDCPQELLDENGIERPEITLISFTVNGTSYQAEDGMTWGEWVNSSYNTGGFRLDSNNAVSGTLGMVSTDGSSSEKGTDAIIANYSYTYYTPGGGDSND